MQIGLKTTTKQQQQDITKQIQFLLNALHQNQMIFFPLGYNNNMPLSLE